MRIVFNNEISSSASEQVQRLKDWYKRLDYYWGDAGKEDGLFKAFFNNFSTCPLCKNKNDKALLIELYFSKEPSKKYIRDHLMELMKRLKINEGKIKIGVPCCECFKKFYEK